MRLVPPDEITEVVLRVDQQRVRFSILELNPEKQYDKEIIITPHHRENYGNVNFWKLKIYCDRHRIKLTSFGTLNQLPVFSTFSDKVILQNNFNLTQLYTPVSLAGANKAFIKHLSSAEYAEVKIRWKQYNVLMNPGPRPRPGWFAINRIVPYLGSAIREVTNEEVVKHFWNPTVWIRESTYEKYKELAAEGLPRDIVCAEFKGSTAETESWVSKLCYPMMGMDRSFQKDLLKKCSNHFMGVQIFASMYSNWFFACRGGSSNLMIILPTKTILLDDDWISPNANVRAIARGIYSMRYPGIGDRVPLICPHRVNERLDSVLNEVNHAMEQMAKETYETISVKVSETPA